jgi:hypothetical protein
MKETSAAKYYLVEMEFSNDDKDPMKQLNIWLKGTFIHDVLKCLATDDKDAKPLFDGIEKIIATRELAEVRLEANGANICRSNTSNGYIYIYIQAIHKLLPNAKRNGFLQTCHRKV